MKLLTTFLLVILIVTGCSQAEKPLPLENDESSEQMTEGKTKDNPLKEIEASAEEKEMIESHFEDESFETILKVEMDPDFKGDEFFTKSIVEREGHSIAVFRSMTYYKKELLVLFKVESGENKNSPYSISGLMPYTFEDTQFVIVERTLHPNNQIAYFVVGKPVYENDIRLVVDNAVYRSEPIANGEIIIGVNDFVIKSPDPTVKSRTHFFTDTNIYEQE